MMNERNIAYIYIAYKEFRIMEFKKEIRGS